MDTEFYNEIDENDSFQYKELLSQVKETIILLGNWKLLSTNFIDSKCVHKDVNGFFVVCFSIINKFFQTLKCKQINGTTNKIEICC
jgi:hypothetical protein